MKATVWTNLFDLLDNWDLGSFDHGRVIRVNRQGDDTLAEIDLPGVDPKDLKVEVQNDILTIAAQGAGRQHRYQLDVSSVDQDNIEAKLVNGLLTLTFRKPAAAKSRAIQVAVA